MSMQITNSPINNTVAPQQTTRGHDRREAFAQMSKAMQSGDLSSAQAAYATLVQNAPPGATLQAGSPFAQLGKALLSGDMSAAQSAWSSMVQDRQGAGATTSPVDTGPVTAITSSTGGLAGSTLSVTA